MLTVFAMTAKGHAILESLVDVYGSSFIDQVIGAKDENIADDYYTNIQEFCEQHQILFSDRSAQIVVHTQYAFAVSWRWLIDLNDTTRLIVFHDSLLPKYRGFAPLVNSLINGEGKIGVTALFANAEYDRGDVIYQSYSNVLYPVTIAEAIEIVNNNYRDACITVAGMIASDKPIPASTQNEAEASYSLWRDEEDYRINWNTEAAKVKRFIDATGYPYKGASTLMNGVLIRVLKAEIVEDVRIENRDAGKIIFVQDGKPVVVCGSGLLKIIAATYESGESILPIKKFRSRFN